MRAMIVRTQDEYNKAVKVYQKMLTQSYFDVDSNKGIEILEEVDYLLYNFLRDREDRIKTEAELSRYYFTEDQARGIVDFFRVHQPDDLYDIERGLNKLYLYRDRELNLTKSLIEIRGSEEKITAAFRVSVYDASVVEASGYAVIYAYDGAVITARDHVLVHAFNRTNVEAYDNASVVANHNSVCTLYGKSTAVGHNAASLKANNNTAITLYGKSTAVISGFARATLFNNSSIIACDHASVEAYDKAVVEAKNTVRIRAENDAVIIAADRVSVSGKDNVLVIARETVDCSQSENIRKIASEKNSSELLDQNIRSILDLPFFHHDPLKAANLLFKATLPQEREVFMEAVKKYESLNESKTERYLARLQQAAPSFCSSHKDKGVSWKM